MKNDKELEKLKIIFNESKSRLKSSIDSSEQLDKKSFTLATLYLSFCTLAIGVMKFVDSDFRTILIVLIIGFLFALSKLSKAIRTLGFASNGIEARKVFKLKKIKYEDGSYLKSLAFTYDDKAKHNYKCLKIRGKYINSSITIIKWTIGIIILLLVLNEF